MELAANTVKFIQPAKKLRTLANFRSYLDAQDEQPHLTVKHIGRHPQQRRLST